MRRLLLAALVVVASFSARAEARFGDKGVLSPYGGLSFAYDKTALASDGGTVTQTSVYFSPGALYFVGEGLALGLAVTVGHSDASTTASNIVTINSTTLGLAPVAAFNVWLGERASLFPQASLSLGTVANSSTNDVFSSRVTYLVLALSAPLLFHPVPHFFVGGGPTFSYQLLSKTSRPSSAPTVDGDKTTTLGLLTTIGGWF